VRTAAVALCVAVFALTTTRAADYLALEPKHWMWLTLSGAAAAASWVFYFRAIYAGEVSKVVLIDKASVVIALLGAWWLLGESITAQKAVGAGLILAGLVVIARS
jgi:transporter family protein